MQEKKSKSMRWIGWKMNKDLYLLRGREHSLMKNNKNSVEEVEEVEFRKKEWN